MGRVTQSFQSRHMPVCGMGAVRWAAEPTPCSSSPQLKSQMLSAAPSAWRSPQLEGSPPLSPTSELNSVCGLTDPPELGRQPVSGRLVSYRPFKFLYFTTRWLPGSLSAQVQRDTTPARRSCAFFSSPPPASALSNHSGVNDCLKTLLEQS